MSSPKSKRAVLIYFGAAKIAFIKVEHFKDSLITKASGCAEKIYAVIESDLSLFDKANFLEKETRAIDAGEFCCIYSNDSVSVWVYYHEHYVTCSSAVYTAFTKLSANVKTTYTPPKWCNKKDHYLLQAFYEDNRGLHEYYRIKSDQRLLRQIDLLDSLLKGDCPQLNSTEALMYHTYGNTSMTANQYHGDVWSKRLCGALQELYPDLKVTHTAEDGPKFQAVQEKSSGISSDHIACYLFRGAPDITLKYSPIVCETTGTSSDETSSEEAIEGKHKADNQSHVIPPMVGELLALLHVLIVQKCLRMVVRKPDITKDSLTCNGLYINKQTSGILVSMKMPIVDVDDDKVDNRTVSIVVEHCSGFVNKSKLCHLTRRLVEEEIEHS